ncbi:hypothetical protein [Streptomyces niger]|uniref:hypothetical protein n=1 Tax=Streptomyces niger TaxID=66373 RepID=UPI000B0AB7A6|nr:hypothetical protein [Streptomyces niger]
MDEEMRALAQEIQHAAGDTIWAPTLATARQHCARIEPLHERFNGTANRIFASLF